MLQTLSKFGSKFMRLLTSILNPCGDSLMKMSGMLFISPRGIQIRDSGLTLFVHDETPLFLAVNRETLPRFK